MKVFIKVLRNLKNNVQKFQRDTILNHRFISKYEKLI